MRNLWKKLTGIETKEKKLEEEKAQAAEAKTPEDIRRESLEKEKAEATRKGEPWVAVLDTQVNPENIRNGFFEIDWNNEFIECLLDAGYKGETNEQIVDAWFRTIVTQMLSEEGVDQDRGMGYINVTPIDKGRSEVS